MSVHDIPELWLNCQFLEQAQPTLSNLFDKLGCVKPLDILQVTPPPDCQNEPDYYQQAEKDPNPHLDMLSDCPKEDVMQECLISNMTPQTGNDDQASLFILSQLFQTENLVEAKKSKNSTTKNILGYETKKVIKLMFSKHSAYLSRKCKAEGIVYRQFKKYYTCMEKKLYGPESLNKMFKIDPNNEKEKQMKNLFLQVFNKILRKEYIVYSLKLGKMHNLHPYIEKKNSHLLYYAECGLNAFQ